MKLSIDCWVPAILRCAEAMPGITGMTCDEEGRHWAIGFEDELVVTVEQNGETDSLSLCADLGRPHAQDCMRIWQTMLLYGSLRASNGGFSMAVAKPEGECQLLCDVRFQDLDARQWEFALSGFASRARMWRRFVKGDDISQPDHARAAGLLLSAGRC